MVTTEEVEFVNDIKTFDDFVKYVQRNNTVQRINKYDTKDGLQEQFDKALNSGKEQIYIKYIYENHKGKLIDVAIKTALFDRHGNVIAL